jgi:transposase
VEVILGKERRRWSEDDKRALVAETFVEGETVHGVARRHSVSSSMLFSWRKRYREVLGFPAATATPARRRIEAGASLGFAPVAIASPAPCPPPAGTSAGSVLAMEVEMKRGVRVRLFGAADPDLAAAVMQAMPKR